MAKIPRGPTRLQEPSICDKSRRIRRATGRLAGGSDIPPCSSEPSSLPAMASHEGKRQHWRTGPIAHASGAPSTKKRRNPLESHPLSFLQPGDPYPIRQKHISRRSRLEWLHTRCGVDRGFKLALHAGAWRCRIPRLNGPGIARQYDVN